MDCRKWLIIFLDGVRRKAEVGSWIGLENLNEGTVLDTETPVPFDFLVDGQFLRTSIAEYLVSNAISLVGSPIGTSGKDKSNICWLPGNNSCLGILPFCSPADGNWKLSSSGLGFVRVWKRLCVSFRKVRNHFLSHSDHLSWKQPNHLDRLLRRNRESLEQERRMCCDVGRNRGADKGRSVVVPARLVPWLFTSALATKKV